MSAGITTHLSVARSCNSDICTTVLCSLAFRCVPYVLHHQCRFSTPIFTTLQVFFSVELRVSIEDGHRQVHSDYKGAARIFRRCLQPHAFRTQLSRWVSGICPSSDIRNCCCAENSLHGPNCVVRLYRKFSPENGFKMVRSSEMSCSVRSTVRH